MPVYWFCKSTDQQNWIILPELILFSPYHLINLTLPYMKYYQKGSILRISVSQARTELIRIRHLFQKLFPLKVTSKSRFSLQSSFTSYLLWHKPYSLCPL